MKLALTCAEICQASYDPKDPRFQTVEDLRFGLIQTEKATVLAFRGTANWRNAARDVLVLPAAGAGGTWVHGGVAGAVDTLLPHVKALDPSCAKPLVVTGHSLGGGVAVEFARILRAPAVTFGCLRVDWRFGTPPDTFHYRFVCDDDPVPAVPRLCYTHQCEPVVLKDKDHELVDVKDHGIDVYVRRLRCLVQ